MRSDRKSPSLSFVWWKRGGVWLPFAHRAHIASTAAPRPWKVNRFTSPHSAALRAPIFYTSQFFETLFAQFIYNAHCIIMGTYI